MAKKNVPAVIGFSPFDRAIISGFSANKSAEEISRSAPINGLITPAQCLERITQLLESKDVLDVQQKRALIVDNVYELAAKLKKQIDEQEWVDKDSAQTYLKTLKELMAMLDIANGQIEESMLRFNARRAQEMTEALIFIFNRMFPALEERYPEIEMDPVQEIVLDAIPASLPEII